MVWFVVYTIVCLCLCVDVPTCAHTIQRRTSDTQPYHSSTHSLETGSLNGSGASLTDSNHLCLHSHTPNTEAAGKCSHGFFFNGFLGPMYVQVVMLVYQTVLSIKSPQNPYLFLEEKNRSTLEVMGSGKNFPNNVTASFLVPPSSAVPQPFIK